MIYLRRGNDFRELENDEAKAVEAYKNAVKDFDSVIEIDLKNAGSEVYEKRAKAYEKLNEPDKAAADRAKAKELAEKPWIKNFPNLQINNLQLEAKQSENLFIKKRITFSIRAK